MRIRTNGSYFINTKPLAPLPIALFFGADADRFYSLGPVRSSFPAEACAILQAFGSNKFATSPPQSLALFLLHLPLLLPFISRSLILLAGLSILSCSISIRLQLVHGSIIYSG